MTPLLPALLAGQMHAGHTHPFCTRRLHTASPPFAPLRHTSSPVRLQVFQPARPLFFRMGDEGELKAMVSFFLWTELGRAYDLGDFLEAWDSGCEVEVALKARKADLTGMDKARIKTTVKQVTLKAEVRIMYNNARSYLTSKIWAVYREMKHLPSRPRGEQKMKGKKAGKIEDPAWEVHAKELQGVWPPIQLPLPSVSVARQRPLLFARRRRLRRPQQSPHTHRQRLHLPYVYPAVAAAQKTSRYGAPYMEGPFSDNPEEDCSLDPVGQYPAVRALALVFKGIHYDEETIREQIYKSELLEFSILQIALFATVVCLSPPSPSSSSARS